jgi:Bacterial dnaA protein helix-turn-helix
VTRFTRRRRFVSSLHFVNVVLEVVAAHYGVPVAAIRSHGNSPAIARVRHVAMYTLRHATTLSYPQIGLAIGGFDHSTVISACRGVERGLTEDPTLQWDLLHVAGLIADRTQVKLAAPPAMRLLNAQHEASQVPNTGAHRIVPEV